jgi:L-fuconolactonase
MPDFPIVDAHVHLYDIERFTYGWLDSVPKLKRTHGLAEFDAARANVGVDRIVFAEVAIDPGLHIEEAAFVQSLAERDARLCASVAHAPLEKGAAVEVDLVTLAKFPTVKGIRRLIETERNPAFCLEPCFLSGLRLLPKFGFTFDICVKHWGLVYALELVRRCPDVAFVLDHIGKPDIKNGLREPWFGQIRALAGLPNIVCKISGVITEADHQHWKRQDVEPYIAHAIECFGFDRIMYGSDWTVSNLTHAYPIFVEILDEILTGCTEADLRRFYRSTATRVYRLPS